MTIPFAHVPTGMMWLFSGNYKKNQQTFATDVASKLMSEMVEIGE